MGEAAIRDEAMRVTGLRLSGAIPYFLGCAIPDENCRHNGRRLRRVRRYVPHRCHAHASAHGSRKVTTAFRRHAQTVRVAGGVLIAAAAVVIYNGWAESLQTKVPGYAQWVQNAIEGSSI